MLNARYIYPYKSVSDGFKNLSFGVSSQVRIFGKGQDEGPSQVVHAADDDGREEDVVQGVRRGLDVEGHAGFSKFLGR